MDWGTHIVLAAKLLGCCGLDKGAAIYSDLPAIDIKPAHYHRVYAHILENLPSLLDVALEIFGSDEVAHRDFGSLTKRVKTKVGTLRDARSIYAYTRIAEETETFIGEVNEGKELLDDESIARISRDKMSAGVSLISHLYFDTFNNPVQAFLPYSSRTSAQWDLWDNIDYMRFRSEFYSESSITAFRREITQNGIWDVKLSPPAIIKAMIISIGEVSDPAIKYDIIDSAVRKFLRYMDVSKYQRVDSEIGFLCLLEDEIIRAIKTRFPKKTR